MIIESDVTSVTLRQHCNSLKLGPSHGLKLGKFSRNYTKGANLGGLTCKYGIVRDNIPRTEITAVVQTIQSYYVLHLEVFIREDLT